DGKVNVKPFNIKYQDIKATIGGSHGFDQSMNYNIKFDVPAKYLGTETNALIAKLAPADAAKLQSIPINATLVGNFTNPKITTDINSAVTKLTTQLANQQKDRMVKQGTSALTDFINKNQKPADTSKTATPATQEDVKTKATDLLNGLFNKKKKTEDPATP
ncbi:MAG TPA: AsmA-like C-terminal region-containing protein, partial [Flavobacterium sp.]|nr:AsmA-like C-terminal region-containing protein [Flavobacterium sp.]